jgi:hypothetical protein
MDADLESYMGLHQYNRIRFTDSSYHFKAGVYILNANHGQFNSSWGVNDVGYPHGLLLNRRNLLSAEAQQQAALVCITSFVKTTLGEIPGYVQLFRDHRAGREWLPETGYISQYADNRVLMVADFEEDVDLLTASLGDQATIGFDGLAALYEEENELRKGSLGTKTVMIGWNNTDADAPGTYTIRFDQPLDLTAGSFRALQFDVAVLDRYPGERMQQEREGSEGSSDEKGVDYDKTESPWYEMGVEEPGEVGFSISLTDVDGNTASVAVSEHYPLTFPEQIPLYKLKVFNQDPEPEPVPQHVEISMQYFYAENPEFDKEKLSSIQFVFDRAPDGMVSIDNIGFTNYK